MIMMVILLDGLIVFLKYKKQLEPNLPILDSVPMGNVEEHLAMCENDLTKIKNGL